MCMFKFGFCRQGRMGERKILRQSAILAFLRALPQRPIFSSNFFLARSLLQTGNLPPHPCWEGVGAPIFVPFPLLFLLILRRRRSHEKGEREREKRKRRESLRGGVAVVVAGRYQRRSPDPHSHRARSAFVRRRLRGEVAGFFCASAVLWHPSFLVVAIFV